MCFAWSSAGCWAEGDQNSLDPQSESSLRHWQADFSHGKCMGNYKAVAFLSAVCFVLLLHYSQLVSICVLFLWSSLADLLWPAFFLSGCWSFLLQVFVSCIMCFWRLCSSLYNIVCVGCRRERSSNASWSVIRCSVTARYHFIFSCFFVMFPVVSFSFVIWLCNLIYHAPCKILSLNLIQFYCFVCTLRTLFAQIQQIHISDDGRSATIIWGFVWVCGQVESWASSPC